MASTSGSPSPSTFLRWTALIVIAASIAFIVNYSKLGTSATITEMLSEYGTALVPRAFAQAMGVAIVAAFAVFLVDALRPRRRRARLCDELAVALAVCSVLAAGWVVAFRHGKVTLAFALVAANLVLSYAMFVRVATAASSERSSWLRIPCGLLFGAMTIAAPVALTQWLHASEVLATMVVTPHDEATALLLIGVVAGGLVALRHGDLVYPAVIASCAGAMFIAQRASSPTFAAAALTVGVGMIVVAGLGAVALSRRRARDAAAGASRRHAKRARGPVDETWYLTEPSTSIMRH
jgi:hypothetical protein